MQNLKSILFLIILKSIFTLQSPQHHQARQVVQGKIQPTAFSRKINENCYDRLLLLVCSNYCNISLPIDSRREILRILSNYSSRRTLPFSVHARANMPVPNSRSSNLTKHPIFENDCAKINSTSEAFVLYLIARRPFVFEFSNRKSKDQGKKLLKWLQIFEKASNSIRQVDATELDSKIDDQSKHENQSTLVLLLFSNRCRFENDFNDSSTNRFFAKIAESLSNRFDRLIFLQMNVDNDRNEQQGWNQIFVEHRLIDIDLSINDHCPRLILIKKGRYFLDYHNQFKNSNLFPNLYENRTYAHLREFVLESEIRNSNSDWTKLGDSLTDIEYVYHSQESILQEKLINRKFVAIGTTGGIGVIVLAVSIFWGLKSSSYTGVTQTAILAITETNPSLMMAGTKSMKRHSSF